MRILSLRVRSSLLLVGAATALLAGCGADPGPAAPSSSSAAADGSKEVSEMFNLGDAEAITYDPARVPINSSVRVKVASTGDSTTTTLTVEGLNPNSTYGAHAHVMPCGNTGDAAGPHFQFRQDPVKPSVDPAYANPMNEIWLDVKTDASGDGTSTSTVPWTFPADRRAKSVIIHDMATMTAPGKAGTAGSRPGCVNVPF